MCRISRLNYPSFCHCPPFADIEYTNTDDMSTNLLSLVLVTLKKMRRENPRCMLLLSDDKCKSYLYKEILFFWSRSTERSCRTSSGPPGRGKVPFVRIFGKFFVEMPYYSGAYLPLSESWIDEDDVRVRH